MSDNLRNGGIVRDMDLTFLAQAEPVATGKLLIDWTPILLSLFATISTIGVPLIAYFVIKANANAKKAADAIVEVRETTAKAVETLKEVKLDVNSGKTKLEDKLTKVEEKLLVITGEKATADEKVRSEQDKATTLAATKVTPPL